MLEYDIKSAHGKQVTYRKMDNSSGDGLCIVAGEWSDTLQILEYYSSPDRALGFPAMVEGLANICHTCPMLATCTPKLTVALFAGARIKGESIPSTDCLLRNIFIPLDAWSRS